MGKVRSVLAAACLVLATAVGTAAADDLDAARARRADLQKQLDAAAQRLADLQARAGELETERDALAQQLADFQTEIEAAAGRTQDRVRSLYKRGSVDPMLVMLSTEEPDEALERAAIVAGLVRDDRAVGEAAAARRVQAAAVASRLEERQAELDAAVVAQQEASGELQGDLQEAAALERRLEEEARRRAEAEARRRAADDARRRAADDARRRAARQARPAAASGAAAPAAAARVAGAYACPVGQPRTFTDTWGAPRSGGRRHRGTDILAPYGTAIYAVTDGVVDIRSFGSSAGNWAIFRGSDGNQYWYMHLQSWTVRDGARVSAGTQIGTNGDTGNARGTPHLHFELHPGGGGAVNPYSLLRRIC